MNEKLKIILICIAVLLIPLFLALYSAGLYKVIAPVRENIRREVFENTKSYSHGKIQDLAKYYEEYKKANEAEKQTIREVVKVRFAEFDASRVSSFKLRNFLIQMRGY